MKTEADYLIVSNVSNDSEKALHLPANQPSEPPQQSERETEFSHEDSARMAHIIIFSPYLQEPYSLDVQNKEMTIGRAGGSSDIILARDELTSRHHALLKREQDRYLIYDRRSANGVQVNGQQIQSDDGFP